MPTSTWHNDNNNMLIKKHADRIISKSDCSVLDAFSLLKLLLSTTKCLMIMLNFYYLTCKILNSVLFFLFIFFKNYLKMLIILSLYFSDRLNTEK